jgi:RimJ/RimL family protein N-acetyltransferase
MNDIITERLVLKPLQQRDDQSLFALHSDPEVMKYIREPDRDIFQTKKRIKSTLDYTKKNPELGIWCVFSKDDQTFIGWGLLLHIEMKLENPIEVGFRLHVDKWRKGYGFEVGSALVRYGKDIGLKSISGITISSNIGSQKTLEKCGLSYIEDRLYYDIQCRYYEMKF